MLGAGLGGAAGYMGSGALLGPEEKQQQAKTAQLHKVAAAGLFKQANPLAGLSSSGLPKSPAAPGGGLLGPSPDMAAMSPEVPTPQIDFPGMGGAMGGGPVADRGDIGLLSGLPDRATLDTAVPAPGGYPNMPLAKNPQVYPARNPARPRMPIAYPGR